MNSYLTRIAINPRRRASRRVMSSPHYMHGAVNACYPQDARPTRLLWRVDHTESAFYLYLVGDVRPDPAGFVEEHGWEVPNSWQTRDYMPILAGVKEGGQYGFRLAANPVRNISGSNEVKAARGKRLAHVTVTQQLGWFLERVHRWGFSVGDRLSPSVRIVERRALQFRRQERRVTIGMAVFEGFLTVTDADVLRERMLGGVGPAKAYGCGLLTLAPLA